LLILLGRVSSRYLLVADEQSYSVLQLQLSQREVIQPEPAKDGTGGSAASITLRTNPNCFRSRSRFELYRVIAPTIACLREGARLAQHLLIAGINNHYAG
jgi:hypothetical protein